MLALGLWQGTSVDPYLDRIKDPIVRQGFKSAVDLNLGPAATQKVYPGHFCINADGGGYGNDSTWPGLDSWQMAGAYLLIGQVQIAKDYFDFVQASQRKDGNIPFAIFTGETPNDGTYLRGLKTPQDVFSYDPPKRRNLPASSQVTRKWVGLFKHWELESNPLATLGPICYILTAAEIYRTTHDTKWLATHLASVEATGQYLRTQISGNGLIAGSGFYTERPPRNGWDGVTQCYAVEAFHDLEALCVAAGKRQRSKEWKHEAALLTEAFSKLFWRADHFAEYLHVTHGIVDSHGLTDTNWAAIAFGLGNPAQTRKLWPKLIAEKAFWPGSMPTTTATKPNAYEVWEHEVVPFAGVSVTNDVAAMGRSWYVEALACKRMGATDRLIESARLVASAAKGGYWRERYHPNDASGVTPAGSEKYCEYPAVFVRVVLENQKVFLK